LDSPKESDFLKEEKRLATSYRGRIGERLVAAEPVRENGVPNTIEAAIYALFGLVVAFTFAGAASRFDARRTQIDAAVKLVLLFVESHGVASFG
jgi:hypothetical protein